MDFVNEACTVEVVIKKPSVWVGVKNDQMMTYLLGEVVEGPHKGKFAISEKGLEGEWFKYTDDTYTEVFGFNGDFLGLQDGDYDPGSTTNTTGRTLVGKRCQFVIAGKEHKGVMYYNVKYINKPYSTGKSTAVAAERGKLAEHMKRMRSDAERDKNLAASSPVATTAVEDDLPF